jgi:CheY-like chemotaxis protein
MTILSYHQPRTHLQAEDKKPRIQQTEEKKRMGTGQAPFAHSSGRKYTPTECGLVVLLVEDNELVRTLVASMLKLLGHAAVCAKDAFEAAEVFNKRQNDIDVVLSDVVMPGKSGWDLLANLRKNGACTPVILTSGYYENPARPPKSAAQPQAFLHKPFTIKALEEALQHAVGTPPEMGRKATFAASSFSVL